MRHILSAAIMILVVSAHVYGAENITGEYKTRQQNLTGTLKIEQLPDNQLKFNIYTDKKATGDYAGRITTCSADGIVKFNEDGNAVFTEKNDSSEVIFKILFHLKKNQISVESNAEDAGMCGMGVGWLDGKYTKVNNKKRK